MFLIAFHVAITALSFLSRNMVNAQVLLFLGLRKNALKLLSNHKIFKISLSVFLVYFSEFLNELGAKNWQLFSKQQYFDANGLFISTVFSTPILLNCIFLLARFLHQSFDLMTKVKAAQLKQQLKNRREAEQSATVAHAKDD